MSAKEFWKDDPQLFISYRTYFINKKNRELEEEDYKSWLRGVYIHDGNSKLLARLQQFIINILASFSKKGKKDMNKIELYPTKPYSELKKDKDLEIQKNKENYTNFEKDLQYYGTLKQQYMNKLKLKKGE